MERFRKIWLRIVLAAASLVVVVLLLMLLAGVFHDKVDSEAGRAAGTSAGRYPAERIGEAVARDLPQSEWAVGTVRAIHRTTLGARLLSTVVGVHVEAGQDVARDEVLVELDDRDLKARLAQVEAGVEVAQATWDQAKSDFERISPLAADGSASAFELTTATNALRTAQAQHERAVQDRLEAETALTYTVIRAPVSGRIVDKLVDVGDMVTPGQPLVTMYDPTRMQLVATVRESLRQRLEVGQQVSVKLDVLDHPCEATVAEIVPEAATASRSFEVKVTGPCPPGVYPGMFGQLGVPLGSRRAVCVPGAAVRRVGQLDLVRVIEGDQTRRRLVQLGRPADDGLVEVLSGLSPGERVVLPESVDSSSEADRAG
ncbi:MAG TPA: efflux RND transporter periplasmic adaptor subunit [Phycisphaerae bacterium]|nr:efflux RND transporter periplasmic adaptor subunit [Phycisphaerae bacterium]